MVKSLYVGNLAATTTSDDLRELFGRYGTVKSANVMSDRGTGQSRGFGFVDMFNGSTEAIKQVNGLEFQGRTLVVNEARPQERSGGRRR